MSQLEPIRIETAQPVPAPVGAEAVLTPAVMPPGAIRRTPLQRLLFGFTREGRCFRAEIAELAELGRDVLDGREDIAKLKGAAAEPYFRGLDALEIRGERLLEVLAIRARQGQRNPWRQSPQDRLAKKQPKTPVGRRQAEWLEKLERAGMIGRPTTH